MKNFFKKLKALVVATFDKALDNLFAKTTWGPSLKQGGFVLLSRPYAGYASGTVVELSSQLEAALIASGGATDSAGPPTTGNVSTTELAGCAAIAAGSSSVTITNPAIKKQTKVWAAVAQAVADGTLLRVERVVCADGSVTIYGTANATATTLIDWAVIQVGGVLSNPQ